MHLSLFFFFSKKNIWDLNKHIKKEKKNLVSSAHTFIHLSKKKKKNM